MLYRLYRLIDLISMRLLILFYPCSSILVTVKIDFSSDAYLQVVHNAALRDANWHEQLLEIILNWNPQLRKAIIY